jgi:methionyl-tRNA formyltransferase
VVDVLKRSVEYGWTLFQQTLPLLESIDPRKQDDSQATYYNKGDNARLGERSGFTREASLQAHGAHR